MSKKPNHQPNSRNKSKNRRELNTPLTTNPFLNFFLNKCGVKMNSKLHKFAKAISTEWSNMNYHEKSPYYQLADKARMKRMKLLVRSSFKDHKTREESKSVTFEPKEAIKNEENNSKKNESLSSRLEDVPKDQVQAVDPPEKILENWIADSEFVTQADVEDKVIEEHPVSVSGSFHSMRNNCSQIDIIS